MTRPDRSRLAVIAWAVVVAAVCGRPLLFGPGHSVYPIFADAGRHWLAGVELYADEATPFRYSPLAAVILTPFGLLPDRVGAALWRLLNAGVLLAALAWWRRAMLPAGWRAALLLLVLPLAVGSLNNGQCNPLVLGLILATVAATATRRWNTAAACIALATLVKVYPVAVALLLAAVYPRRLAGRFVLALGGGVLVTFLCQSPGYVAGQWLDWWRYLGTSDTDLLPRDVWYRDFRLLCHVVGVPLSAGGYRVAQLVAAAGVAAGCVWLARQGRTRRQVLHAVLGLGCCWMTLFGPATESSTYILLGPSLAAFGVRRLDAAWDFFFLETIQNGVQPPPSIIWQPTVPWVLTLGSYALLVAAQAAVWFPGAKHVHALGPQPLAALLFLAALLSWLPHPPGRRIAAE